MIIGFVQNVHLGEYFKEHQITLTSIETAESYKI